MCNMNGKEEDVESGPNVNEEELSSEGEDDEEMEAENEHVGQVIDVAFEANCPSNTDFHGIKRLLQQLFVKHLNEEISELTNLIISQDFVGCVLKQDHAEEDEDDEDSDDDDKENVYNLNTVVNISQNQSLSCIEKVNEFLTKHCQQHFKTDPSRMANMLGNPSNQVGLLISERFINIPPQVALPSYESLKSDIETAVRKKKKFNFTHLVLVSKTYRAKGDGGLMGGEIFYLNAEEKLFSEICEYQYTFSVADQRDSVSEGQWDDDGGDMESLRTIMVFDASALGHMINKLKTELPAT